jgi:hypothetical protein|tara:strand:- start:270 stop:1625 length:1356 start_codon:yes stop_codon:yes gene_type:complete
MAETEKRKNGIQDPWFNHEYLTNSVSNSNHWLRKSLTFAEFPEKLNKKLVYQIPWSLIDDELRGLLYDHGSGPEGRGRHSSKIYKIKDVSDKFILDTFAEHISDKEYELIYKCTEKFGITKENSIVVTTGKFLDESKYNNHVILNSSLYFLLYDIQCGLYPRIPFSKLYFDRPHIDELKNNKKPYKFLCLNGTCKPYRLYMLDYLHRKGYDKQGLVSLCGPYFGASGWQTPDTIKKWGTYDFGSTLERIRWTYEVAETSYSKKYSFNRDYFSNPPKLDMYGSEGGPNGEVWVPGSDTDGLQGKGSFISKIPFEFYNDTYFGIVNEIIFPSNDGKVRVKNAAVSEKSLVSIIHQPIIVVGYPGILSDIRDMGFKTFPKFVDESYDTIQNDDERFAKILSEIDILMNKDEDELHELYIESMENVVYNQYVVNGNPDMTVESMIEKFYREVSEK